MIIPFSVVFLLYYIFVVVITKIVTKSLHCTYFVKQISYAIRFLSYEIKKVDFPFPPRFSFQEFSSFHRFSLFCIFSPFLSVFTFRCFIFLPLKLSEATSTKMYLLFQSNIQMLTGSKSQCRVKLDNTNKGQLLYHMQGGRSINKAFNYFLFES